MKMFLYIGIDSSKWWDQNTVPSVFFFEKKRRTNFQSSFKSLCTVLEHQIPNSIPGIMLDSILFHRVIVVNTTNAPVNMLKHAQKPAKNISTLSPIIPNSFKISFIINPPYFYNTSLYKIYLMRFFAKIFFHNIGTKNITKQEDIKWECISYVVFCGLYV